MSIIVASCSDACMTSGSWTKTLFLQTVIIAQIKIDPMPITHFLYNHR